MSVIGHITPQELLELLCTVDIANGFANRFILCLARRTKVLPNPIAPPTDKLKAVLERLVKVVKLASQIDEMQFTAEALFYWTLIYRPLSVTNRSGLVAALLARAEAQVLRLAIVYALLDGKAEIDTVHLKAAVAVWEYSERSAYFIFKDATGQSDADVILKALRDASDVGMTGTEISNLFAGGRSAVLLAQALQLLLENGLAMVTREEKGAGTAGRPVNRWRATNKIASIAESRYLALFETPLPSAAQLKKLNSAEKRNAETRVANEAVKESFKNRRFEKLRGNEAQGEKTLEETADKNAA